MITYVIIFLTVVVSIVCMRDARLFRALSLMPYMVRHRGQVYRVITHGFVHADLMHLLVNMLVLFSFGTILEGTFAQTQQAGLIGSGEVWYLWLYFGGMAVASLYDVIVRRNDFNFSSVGASGAVSAVIFTSIFFSPMRMIYFFGVIPMPGIVFGILYLFYERYLAKKANDNINHYAHFFGAVYGFIFPLVMSPSLIHVFLSGFSRQ